MSFDSCLSGLLFTIPEAYHHRLASLRINISKKQVKPHTLLPASHCCYCPTVVCSFTQSMSAGLRSNEEYVLLQVLCSHRCSSLQETRWAFIASSTPILSFPSTPRRRPQRTILPWEYSEGRRVSRRPTLLRQNVNWQSECASCALGVYMCHTKGISANLIILTQEDTRRTRALQKISGVPTAARSCVLSYPTQAAEDIVGYRSLDWFEGMPSCPCFHILDFLKGWAFRSMFSSFFLLSSKLFSCKQTLISSSFNSRTL